MERQGYPARLPRIVHSSYRFPDQSCPSAVYDSKNSPSIHLQVAKISTQPLASQPFQNVAMPTVYLLDYVAGNVRSLVNAIEKLGWTVEWIRSPEDVAKADVSREIPLPSFYTSSDCGNCRVNKDYSSRSSSPVSATLVTVSLNLRPLPTPSPSSPTSAPASRSWAYA
jgi:hypothetical protein